MGFLVLWFFNILLLRIYQSIHPSFETFDTGLVFTNFHRGSFAGTQECTKISCPQKVRAGLEYYLYS